MEQRVGGVGSGNHKIISQLAGLKRVSKSFVKTEVVEGQSEWLQKETFRTCFVRGGYYHKKANSSWLGLKEYSKDCKDGSSRMKRTGGKGRGFVWGIRLLGEADNKHEG